VSRIFEDRYEAGRALAPEVERLGMENPLIIGLPRGGVPLAYEIAMALDAPLETIVVRKLGAPSQPELAVGAIASGGVRVLNDEVLRFMSLDDAAIEAMVARESIELERREKRYRGDREYPDLAGQDVVLVDDGLATGATMRAAIEAVKTKNPASMTVAIPTASGRSLRKVEAMVDHVVCLDTPVEFHAVGQFYVDFSQTTDDEVRNLLERARHARAEE
jgi:putative phosphoribosyl transferase